MTDDGDRADAPAPCPACRGTGWLWPAPGDDAGGPMACDACEDGTAPGADPHAIADAIDAIPDPPADWPGDLAAEYLRDAAAWPFRGLPPPSPADWLKIKRAVEAANP
jgi:hypothetical protein